MGTRQTYRDSPTKTFTAINNSRKDARDNAIAYIESLVVGATHDQVADLLEKAPWIEVAKIHTVDGETFADVKFPDGKWRRFRDHRPMWSVAHRNRIPAAAVEGAAGGR
jgi:hypothetical protein